MIEFQNGDTLPCVGGPLDGRSVGYAGSHSFEVAEPEQQFSVMDYRPGTVPPPPKPLETTRYDLIVFTVEGGEPSTPADKHVAFYKASTISSHEATVKMLNHYGRKYEDGKRNRRRQLRR